MQHLNLIPQLLRHYPRHHLSTDVPAHAWRGSSVTQAVGPVTVAVIMTFAVLTVLSHIK